MSVKKIRLLSQFDYCWKLGAAAIGCVKNAYKLIHRRSVQCPSAEFPALGCHETTACGTKPLEPGGADEMIHVL